MTTVSDDLDLVQEYLHDGGTIWPRSELLRHYSDGYQALLVGSHCTSALTCLEVPGRVTYAIAFEWEARHVEGGTSWHWTWTSHDGQYECTSQWEAQMLEGGTPQQTLIGFTQPWERAYVSDADHQFFFALPRNHERIRGVWWNHRRLEPISVRELDTTEQRWMRVPGEPTRWTDGLGRNRTFEIFAIRTDYQQAYSLKFGSRGIPRHFAGERTYAIHDVSHNPSDTYYGCGLVRRIDSPDRQYWPKAETKRNTPLGTPVDWHSSDSALLVWEVIIPHTTGDLQETDEPHLIPVQAQKYLRYYVLAKAFGRPGEGTNSDLAQHWMQRFERGVRLMTKLSDVAQDTRHWQRDNLVPSRGGRPPRVQFPSNFPKVHR